MKIWNPGKGLAPPDEASNEQPWGILTACLMSSNIINLFSLISWQITTTTVPSVIYLATKPDTKPRVDSNRKFSDCWCLSQPWRVHKRSLFCHANTQNLHCCVLLPIGICTIKLVLVLKFTHQAANHIAKPSKLLKCYGTKPRKPWLGGSCSHVRVWHLTLSVISSQQNQAWLPRLVNQHWELPPHM